MILAAADVVSTYAELPHKPARLIDILFVIAFEQMLKKAEDARITVKTVIEPVAEALGNTPAISRKSYVHPALLEAVKEDPRDPLDGLDRPRARKRLSSAEVGFLKFLAAGGRKQRRRRKPAS
jgi:DNA topoisomerase-1